MITEKDIRVEVLTPEQRAKKYATLGSYIDPRPQWPLIRASVHLATEMYIEPGSEFVEEQATKAVKIALKRAIYSNIVERQKQIFELRRFVQNNCHGASAGQVDEMFAPIMAILNEAMQP